MDKNENQLKDALWCEVKDVNNAQINFIKDKRRYRLKSFFKGIIFILVASISGGVTATYVINRKYADSGFGSNSTPLFQERKVDTTSTNQAPEGAITKVSEVVGPAVVGITNKVENFFGEEKSGAGSGIIFKADGYVVTNYHVINGANKVIVKLSSGNQLTATVVGYDEISDLAIIKVDAKNLPIAVFGDSTKVRVGDTAIAIGNPLGEDFSGSVTAGIISALNRNINITEPTTGETTRYKVLQTDAAINPGNSGGALCNLQGEVIGINSLKMGAKENAEGMGFAISINEAKKIIEAIMKDGRVIRPFIGIYGDNTGLNGYNQANGAYVKDIVKGSGAEIAGIKPGDIITELDGVKISKFDDIREVMDKHKIGDVVSGKVIRKDKGIDIKIKLTELKQNNR